MTDLFISMNSSSINTTRILVTKYAKNSFQSGFSYANNALVRKTCQNSKLIYSSSFIINWLEYFSSLYIVI